MDPVRQTTPMQDHVTTSDSLSAPDNLQEALMDVFRPVLQELDIIVEETRNSQQDVKRQVDILVHEFQQVSDICEISPTLELYAKKIATIKRRAAVMYNILQNVQERLKKLDQSTSPKRTQPSPPQSGALPSQPPVS
ncbi:hypothetical protein RvY_08940 [Ramazzottius varieornatus]|uniref:Biogenesis of lysosome-related organelles complex 1 subunit 7 n=1 Tax=Ramazzottius varieornatus TaxID=947166 RepID=A0A1D1VD76_RAMVA|nr:hypothetical protein RvY_08940 [Ramazzottius varieornatus]